MRISEKIKQLRQIISNQLEPLIDSNYALLELPYYPNIGDNLIWEGTETFLKQLSHTCIYRAAIETFYYHKFSPNEVILLQGGGNFGDLWIRHQNFRKKIIELYPNNKIIILPQSVHYQNEDFIVQDELFFAQHQNAIICARDYVSYEFMKKHFPNNNILLVPDMAFFANIVKETSKSKNYSTKILYAKRNDIELKDPEKNNVIPQNAEIHDWPTFECRTIKYQVAGKIEGIFYYLAKINIFTSVNKLRDLFRSKFFRKNYIKDGITFLNQYDTIYSTRLHIMILAAMLEKKVFLLDNSYGKNSSLYNTWLQDLENVELI